LDSAALARGPTQDPHDFTPTSRSSVWLCFSHIGAGNNAAPTLRYDAMPVLPMTDDELDSELHALQRDVMQLQHFANERMPMAKLADLAEVSRKLFDQASRLRTVGDALLSRDSRPRPYKTRANGGQS
jgi:hypothetical protein